MKKIIVITFIILLMSGCTNNKLVCSSSATSDDIQIIQNFKLTYEKNEIKEFVIHKTYKFEDEERYKSFGLLMDIYKKNIESMKNDGVVYSQINGNKTYKFKLKVTTEDLTDDKLSTLELNVKLDEFQKILEDQGLKCK